MAEIPLGHLIQGNIGGTEPVAAPDDPRNILTVRESRNGKRTVIPRGEWQFAHTVNGSLAPSDRFIHLNGGFQPGKIYEYVYVVADPVVAGGGFAAIRDFASYAKHNPDALTPAKRVYGEGISQNGRFLRDFLYQGFNADEDGRMALDGVLAHVAGAGRGSFNYRFAQPSRDAQPTSSVFFPTDIFPFTDQPETDPLTGETGGLLDRAIAGNTVPMIFFSNTSYEYWGRVAALIHVSPDGKRDAKISDNVRIYHFTGLQHFSGPFRPEKGKGRPLGQEPQSPLPIRYFWRAMITNMDAWVGRNIPPPASSYPRLEDGTLVPLDQWTFPSIPAVNTPQEANEATRLDFGPDWRKGFLTLQPPRVRRRVSRSGAASECGWQRAGRRAPAGDHCSTCHLYRLEPARSRHRRSRSASRLRGVVHPVRKDCRRPENNPAIRASRLRSAMLLARSISPDSRLLSTL